MIDGFNGFLNFDGLFVHQMDRFCNWNYFCIVKKDYYFFLFFCVLFLSEYSRLITLGHVLLKNHISSDENNDVMKYHFSKFFIPTIKTEPIRTIQSQILKRENTIFQDSMHWPRGKMAHIGRRVERKHFFSVQQSSGPTRVRLQFKYYFKSRILCFSLLFASIILSSTFGIGSMKRIKIHRWSK